MDAGQRAQRAQPGHACQLRLSFVICIFGALSFRDFRQQLLIFFASARRSVPLLSVEVHRGILKLGSPLAVATN